MKLFISAVALCLIATSYCADKKPGQTCTKEDKCLEDSECKQTDLYCPAMTCVCKGSNKEVKNEKCVDKAKPKSTLEGACTKDDECEGSSLKCTNTKCACPTATPNYIKKTMTCTVKVLFGGECDDTKKCDANMDCTGSPTKKCACKATHEKEDVNDQQCSKTKYTKFGEDCTTIPCNKDMLNLECSADKKCVCPANFKDMTVYYMMDNTAKSVKKCLHANATVDAAKDEKCSTGLDKSAGASYCKKDLKCQGCPITAVGADDLKCREKSKDTSGVGQLTFSMSVVLGCYALKKIFM